MPQNVEVTTTNTGGSLKVQVTFSENTGDVPDMRARYCWKYGAAATEPEVQCHQANGDWADANGKALNLYGVATSDNARLALTTLQSGADNSVKENVECSNRGMCDYSSGICKCFHGFMDFDCSRIRVIDMD